MKNYFLKNKNIKSFLDFFSRLSISAIFISAIPGKINNFERTVEYISSKGIPEQISSILLVGAIICLILGSVFFIFGENQKIGSVFLLLFLSSSQFSTSRFFWGGEINNLSSAVLGTKFFSTNLHS